MLAIGGEYSAFDSRRMNGFVARETKKQVVGRDGRLPAFLIGGGLSLTDLLSLIREQNADIDSKLVY